MYDPRNKKLTCCCDSRSYWQTTKPVTATSFGLFRFFRLEFTNAPKLDPLKRDWPKSTYELTR